MAGSQALVEQALRAIEAKPGALVAVVGPTGSGKTELGLALAEALGGEIVGADSVQIYRHFDIGSGKPTPAELARAPHHMVSVAEPAEPFDAAVYAERAGRAIEEIASRGKRPVVVGGTYLWIKALLFGLAPAPPADEALRARYREVAAREGAPALHARLARVDGTLAARLHPNDAVRIVRGLEVFELTGKPLSAWQDEHGFRDAVRPSVQLAVERSGDAMRERLERRVAAWLEAGWVEEVESLVARGYRETRAMGSVGYRQVLDHVEGRLPRAELLTAIVRATRVFVRRQKTWLRSADVRRLVTGD